MKIRHTVLIVDDTPENICILGDMLENDGYGVMIATSGPDALENARETPHPDLILLDIMMPDMDGFEVCRRLKADPELEKIPVIFISVLNTPEQKVEAFHRGAVDYVTKPFQVKEVLARVATHIQLARTEELKQEVAQRIKAEEELQNLNISLEKLVSERTAQLQESNECLESFCWSISHDLRGPTSNLSVLCKMLVDDYTDTFDQNGRELLEDIWVSAQKLSVRIQAMLDFSRLSRRELCHAPINLSGMARDILEQLRDMEPERKVEVVIQDGVIAQADADLIGAVIENLLGNAWKYSAKPNTVHLTISI